MAENEYFGLVMSNLKLNIKDKKKKNHNKILMNIFKTFNVSYMKANLQVKTQIIWILLDRGFKIIFQELISLFLGKISRFYIFLYNCVLSM
jgi:hypothetical protein